MICVQCHTNLDEGRRHTWPNKMAALPRVGDYVKSIHSDYKLKVIYLTHSARQDENGSEVHIPFVIVELGKI